MSLEGIAKENRKFSVFLLGLEVEVIKLEQG